MLGKRVKTNFRTQFEYACPSCDKNLEWREEESQFHFLYMKMFTISKKKFWYCATCKKKRSKEEVIKRPAKETVRRFEEDGTLIIEEITRADGEQNINRRWNKINAIPTVHDPGLLAKTTIGIMQILAKNNPAIRIKEDENYQYLKERFSEHAQKIESVEADVIKEAEDSAEKGMLYLYKECRNNFNDIPCDFILAQAISVTKDIRKLNQKNQMFFYELLKIYGFQEKQLEDIYYQFKEKWNEGQGNRLSEMRS